MNDIIPFQPLDLPSDIQIVTSPDFPYYIFHKLNPSYYFRIYIEEIVDKQQTVIRAFKCDKNGRNKDSEIILPIPQNNSIININTFIWYLSDISYSQRYIKKEVIERLRGVITNDKLIEINDLIKNATKNTEDNEI